MRAINLSGRRWLVTSALTCSMFFPWDAAMGEQLAGPTGLSDADGRAARGVVITSLSSPLVLVRGKVHDGGQLPHVDARQEQRVRVWRGVPVLSVSAAGCRLRAAARPGGGCLLYSPIFDEQLYMKIYVGGPADDEASIWELQDKRVVVFNLVKWHRLSAGNVRDTSRASKMVTNADLWVACCCLATLLPLLHAVLPNAPSRDQKSTPDDCQDVTAFPSIRRQPPLGAGRKGGARSDDPLRRRYAGIPQTPDKRTPSRRSRSIRWFSSSSLKCNCPEYATCVQMPKRMELRVHEGR